MAPAVIYGNCTSVENGFKPQPQSQACPEAQDCTSVENGFKPQRVRLTTACELIVHQ